MQLLKQINNLVTIYLMNYTVTHHATLKLRDY